MKKKLFVVLAVSAGTFFSAGSASAQDVFSGDTRSACEAILCLSTGSPPSQCSPALSRYFGIHKRKLSDTLRARLNFLKLCPQSSQTPEMSELVEAISRGAGRCDARSLNMTLRSWRGYRDDRQFYVGNQMPGHCSDYVGHAYTDLDGTLPRYVGDPERGGHWVEALDYDRAVTEYNERIRREDEARSRNDQGYRGVLGSSR